MFAQFRAEVVEVLTAELPDVPLWNVIPDDVNELPCVVVGRPNGRETAERVVWDVDLSVFVVGRRQHAGAAEDELTALLDRVFDALGGTRGTKSSSGNVIAPARAVARMLTIAGLECPAYTVEVTASATTC